MTTLQVIGSNVDVNARSVIDLGAATLLYSTASTALYKEPATTYAGYGTPETPQLVLRGQLSYTASGSLADGSFINEIDIGSAQQGQLIEVLGLSLVGAQLSALHGDQTATNQLLYGGGVTLQDLGQNTTFKAVGGQNTVIVHDPAQNSSIVGRGDGDTTAVPGLRLASTINGNPSSGTASLTTTNPATGVTTTTSISQFGAVQFVDGLVYYGQGTLGGQVDRLYVATLGRFGDPAGLGAWTSRLAGGESLHDVAQSFVGSTEFQQDYGALDNAGFVNLLYHNVLGRPGEAYGVGYWTGALNSGGLDRASVVLGFASSPEFIGDRSGDLAIGQWAPDPVAVDLVGFYKAALNRLPDASGLTSWLSQSHAGLTERQIAQSFYNSTEFQTSYGSLSDAGYVNRLYQNTLGRAGDTFGVQTWTQRLGSGAYSRADVLQGFATSPEMVSDNLPLYASGIRTAG